MTAGRPRLGVDLGGTKIEAALLETDGRVSVSRRIPTPHDYDATLAAVRDLADGLCGRDTPAGVGIPGSPSPATGLVRNANTTFLNGRDLRGDLAQVTGREVRVANDADCFALSEARDGAGAGARVVFGVIIGTGVGGGVAVDGALIPGASGIAGEWGHTPLPWSAPSEHPGPRCWCGRMGCMEQWVSGPAFQRDHGGGLHATEIAAQAEAGDAAAAAALERYVSRLGRGLAQICDILDPAVIVLGGGVSNIAGLYPRLPAAMAPHLLTDTPQVRVVRNVHGDSSGIRGAAWLWPGVANENGRPARAGRP